VVRKRKRTLAKKKAVKKKTAKKKAAKKNTGKKKRGRPIKKKSVKKQILGKKNKWIKAVMQARKEFGITGFLKINRGVDGKKVYNRAKELHVK
jgi:hypothetical protein